jgi:hypothetical protein
MVVAIVVFSVSARFRLLFLRNDVYAVYRDRRIRLFEPIV